MIDLNHQPKFHELVTALLDASIQRERGKQPKRSYLGASRLGVSCERALQFEFTNTPKDEDGDFPGRILRVFDVGHALEDLVINWLRAAGFDLYTRKQDGHNLDSLSRAERSKATWTAFLLEPPLSSNWHFPCFGSARR